MATFVDANKSHELTYARGDSFAQEFIITDADDVVIDITGFTFLLTVNTEKNPVPVGPPIVGVEQFQLTGTITDGPAGKVEFAPSTANTNITIGKYWYDIQMTDTGSTIRTIIKSTFVIVQDVTK